MIELNEIKEIWNGDDDGCEPTVYVEMHCGCFITNEIPRMWMSEINAFECVVGHKGSNGLSSR